MTDRDGPIGVFDSGIGGLTVAREIMRRLPGERVLYFGDTARVPYGPKSPETVRRYSREIGRFLVAEGVKAIVIACNTATAHALHALRDELPVPVIGVVEPGARAAVSALRSGTIGVIGTAGTIASGAYEKAIRELRPDARVVVLACPLFAPLVEEGWTSHPATRIVAEEYLRPFRDDPPDALVLGCTHYPLIAPVLAQVVGPGVLLIDSAAETARETASVLAQHDLCATPSDELPTHRFVASDDPEQFLRLASRFLGRTVDRVEVRTLG
jgi:glutamate racemase